MHCIGGSGDARLLFSVLNRIIYRSDRGGRAEFSEYRHRRGRPFSFAALTTLARLDAALAANGWPYGAATRSGRSKPLASLTQSNALNVARLAAITPGPLRSLIRPAKPSPDFG